MKAMKEQYGAKKARNVFYASKNKGKIEGVEKKLLRRSSCKRYETISQIQNHTKNFRKETQQKTS